jgi:hypothetical protein
VSTEPGAAHFDRLDKYILRRAKAEDLAPEDYIGIATDGDHICFAFHKDGAISHRNLLPFNEPSVALVAQACRDSRRRAVTAENLIEDFGHGTDVGTEMMVALAGELQSNAKSKSNTKIKMLFEEWRALFGQVADMSAAQAEEIGKTVPIRLALPKHDAVAATLFVIHTYNAFVMKLLAAEIVAEYGLTSYPDFCEHLLGCDDDELIGRLNSEVERSAYFEGAGIKGFVEEAIFSWYSDSSVSKGGRKRICAGSRSAS